MTLRPLPLGAHTFAETVGEKLFYADKTRCIRELLKGPEKNCCLLRPRRFGKSLLLDTIEALFTGQSSPCDEKDLYADGRSPFDGLWIKGPESDYRFPSHPVLSLDLSMSSGGPGILRKNLLAELQDIAEDNQLDLGDGPPGACLGRLIKALSRKIGKQVVALIDEYDAPATRNMDQLDGLRVAEANAEVLRGLFGALREDEVSAAVRQTVVTGITVYALTSWN